MKINKIIGLALLSMSFANAVYAGQSAQKTARDERDNIVTNSFGNCVVTKWDASENACAPKAKLEPITVPMTQEPVASIADLSAEEARTVYFDFNKSDLSSEAQSKLTSLADIVKQSKEIVSADVVGYTDMIGDDAYNIALSTKRAASVQAYLGGLINIPTNLANVRGLGKANSVTKCADEKNRDKKIACMAQDRRVVVEFKYKK